MAKRQTKSNSRAKNLKKKSGFSRSKFGLYVLVFAVIGAVALVVSHAAPTGTCIQNQPLVSMDNNYAWAQPGSWGYPGQQLKYFLHITNYDQNCAADTFTVGLSAPQGFSVSIPTNTITLKSGQIGYLWGYVTSPTSIADGDYTLVPSIVRNSNGVAGNSQNNYYKVYSADTTAPSPYWPNPSDGQVISKKQYKSTYQMVVSASDDHAVKTLSIYLDGTLLTTTNCDDISYTCQASYKLPLRGLSGAHIATFKATDWFNNVGTLTSNFTVTN